MTQLTQESLPEGVVPRRDRAIGDSELNGDGHPLETSRAAHWAALVAAMVFPSILTWLYFVVFAGDKLMQPIYGVGKLIQFGFPLTWVLFAQRRRLQIIWSSRGIPLGSASGLVIGAVVVGVYWFVLKDSSVFAGVAAQVTAKLNGAGFGTAGRFLLLASFYSLVHSGLEEFYWRWFVFGQLARVIRFGPAVLISSLAFMAHHVIVIGSYFQDPATVAVLSLGVATGGAIWAWLYRRTGSLIGPWLSHMMVDAALMIVGYDLIFHRAV